MESKVTRRTAVGALASTALVAPLSRAADSSWLRRDTATTPKITLWLDNLEDAALRRVRQLGVEYVCMAGPRLPWEETEVRSRVDKLKAQGLTLFNMMFSGFPNAIYGRPGRDEDIEKVIQSIRVAAKFGAFVVKGGPLPGLALDGRNTARLCRQGWPSWCAWLMWRTGGLYWLLLIETAIW